MAYLSPNAPKSNSVFAAIGEVFWTLFRPLTIIAEANGRARKLEELTSKSDEELARMGLHRSDIPRVVFRDMYYV